MSEPTQPPRRPLATFLRPAQDAAPVDDGLPPAPADGRADDDTAASTGDTPWDDALPQIAIPPAEVDAETDAEPVVEADATPADDALTAGASADDAPLATAPSFLQAPRARLRTPRWQWGLVAGLGVLLLLQIAVADRARLAADAGTRPWIAGLCSVLRCTLPAWREPAAFSMISRDVRPVPGQPGALQVQASFRNDARWAQAWPALRLSLSDADGRLIGTGEFAPADYLGAANASGHVLEPGQSARIAFRVREPAASTVAFTFEFL
ncbi:membrane protein [Stenotrophomonas rhizophila]|nr:membrane protein [Stenotrophomonas rhizophila]